MANTKLPARLLDTSAIPALNVTGDLTVDTTTLKVDSTNNRVGIGTSSPDGKFVVSNGGAEGFEVFPGSASGQNSFQHYNRSGSAYLRNRNIASEFTFNLSGATDDAVIFKAGGNVGIGTNNPLYKLHVSGAGHQRLLVEKTDAGGDADLQFRSQDDSTQWILFNDTDTGNNSGVIKYVHNTNKMHFRTNDVDDRLVISSDGKVGIGTTSPADYTYGDLVIDGAGASAGISLVSNTNSYGGIFFADGTSGSEKYRGFLQYNHNYSSHTDKLLFGTGGATNMVLDGSGKLGIGTSNPGVALDISTSTANTNGVVRIQNNMDNDYEALRLHSLGNHDAQMSFLAQGDSTYWAGLGIDYSDAGKFKLQTDNLFVGGSNLMTWARDGNVGIGTNNPAAKLHVYGTDPVIRVSDDGTSGFATLELRQQNTTSEGFEISYNSSTGHTHLNNVYSSGNTVFGTSTGSFGTTSTNIRMTITDNGHVQIPSQPHWFGSATNTGGSGLANSQTPHSSHSRNTINVSTISGALRWIIPETGVYVISFNTIADSGSTRVDTRIKVNGYTISSQLNATSTSGYRQRSATIIVYVQENDYVQFHHDDWYNASSVGYEEWRTISLTMVS